MGEGGRGPHHGGGVGTRNTGPYIYIYIQYIYIYIQTGSLKTVGQNDIPSRNPVFCVLSGHVFF